MTGFFNQVAAAASTKRGFALVLLFVVLLLYLPGQASIPPLDRDESRFAQATRQMLETGNFVDIRFQDAPRNLQPAGIYWLQAAAVTVFGDADQREIWPHRIPSWASAIGVAFLTWWLAAMLFGPVAGRFAGALMGASFLLGVEAHIAKIDATLSFTTLIAQAALAKIYMNRDADVRLGWWAALFWAAVGFGVLLKGPIILLVVGGTVLGLVVLERRARWLGKLQPLWGLPLMLLLATPWYIAIGIATNGDFFRTALGYSVVGKLTESHQSHGGPPGYHLALWPLMFWPGSLFAAIAAPFVWRERKSEAVRFCLAWLIPAWIVFELSGTKLPHYTLPLLPAVAALAAAALVQAPKAPFVGRPWLVSIAGLIWLICAAAVTFGFIYIENEYQGAAQPLAIGIACIAMALALGALMLVVAGRARAGAVAAVASAALAALNTYQVIMPSLDTLFGSPRIVAAVEAARPCPTTQVVSLRYHEPSFVFLSNAALYPDTADEAVVAVKADLACNLVLLQGEDDPARAALALNGIELEPITTIESYNYNSGDYITTTLYRPTVNQVDQAQ